jgi:hypothetical protein
MQRNEAFALSGLPKFFRKVVHAGGIPGARTELPPHSIQLFAGGDASALMALTAAAPDDNELQAQRGRRRSQVCDDELRGAGAIRNKLQACPGRLLEVHANRHAGQSPAPPQQPLQRRALGRVTGVAAVVVAGADQGPAVMGLAADIGLRRLVLGVEGVELLVEPAQRTRLVGLVVMPAPPRECEARRSEGRTTGYRSWQTRSRSGCDRSCRSRQRRGPGP